MIGWRLNSLCCITNVSDVSADVYDVVEALRFAADHGLKAAAYAAGHQVVGVSLLPNGVVIDTKNLTAIDVDPDSQTAYALPGMRAPFKVLRGLRGRACFSCIRSPAAASAY